MLLTCVLLTVAQSAAGQQLVTRNYTLDDGLPAAQVFSAFQDARGYLWFGTPAGVVRYDGGRMQAFSAKDGLAHDSVRTITSYRDELWLAGEKGAARYRDGAFSVALTAEQGLPRGIVWRMAVFEDALWFGTSKGLARYDGAKVTRYGSAEGLPHDNVFALLPDGEQLWIGTRGGGLCRYDGKAFQRFGPAQGLDAQHVMALVKVEGTLWVGTRDGGVYRQQGERFVKQLADVNVYSVAARGREMFWGTLGQGLIRMQADGRVRRFDTSHALAGDRIYSVMIDREGTPWITTNAGVSKLLSDRFLGYLPGVNVLSVARFGDSMLFGTLGKGLYRLRDDELTQLRVEDGLPHNAVWGLAVDDKRVWLGTSEGICAYDGETITPHLMAGEAQPAVYDIVPDGEAIWLAGPGGICRYQPPPSTTKDGADSETKEAEGETRNRAGSEIKGSCERFGRAQGMPSEVAYGGTRWGEEVCFATEEGIGCVKGSQVRRYGIEQGLPAATVHAVAVDGRGVLWAGTNKGLARLVGERFEAVAPDSEVGTEQISTILEIAPGKLAVTTHRKLLLFDGQRVVRALDRRAGLIGHEPNFDAIAAGAGDTLWVGTSTGVSQYFPEQDHQNKVPPLVEVTGWEANGDEHRGSGIELDSEHSDLLFEYAGLSFRDEDDVRFRYQLLGYDAKWSEPQRARSVRYTNLAPGSYTFQLEAANGDGVWSGAPATVSFSIHPPYWATLWFRALVGLLVLGGGYGVYRLRTRVVRARNEELERLVNERTQQLIEANDELKELSLTDPLTRLKNRRFLREMMVAEVARSQRLLNHAAKSPNGAGNIGFLMIDVDHFKSVNDTHGHDAGDIVLKSIAGIICQTVREMDAVVRWGGEEFLVVCKDVDRDALLALAERLNQAVRALDVALPDGEVIQRTCSIGYSLFPFMLSAPELFNYEEVIGFADMALYVAKGNGRDRVVGMSGTDKVPPAEHKVRVKTDAAYAQAQGYAVISGGDVPSRSSRRGLLG